MLLRWFVMLAVGAGVAPGETRVLEMAEVHSILLAADLPGAAQRLRAIGVPDDDVQRVLIEARRRGMDAGETRVLFEESIAAAGEFGVLNDYAAVVLRHLGRGKTGRILIDEIRRAHSRQGFGRRHTPLTPATAN